MKLKGYIKFQNKVKVKNQESYGLTEAIGDHFRILISRESSKDFYLFSETILHELIHLGYFVIMACSTTTNLSERSQHAMINKIMPVMIAQLRKHCKGKKK